MLRESATKMFDPACHSYSSSSYISIAISVPVLFFLVSLLAPLTLLLMTGFIGAPEKSRRPAPNPQQTVPAHGALDMPLHGL